MKNTCYRAALYSATILAGMAGATPVFAAPAPGDAAPPASNAKPDNNADTTPEVIVTARRIEERLQDVPISITVMNQDELTTKNINSTNDLAAFTPSLTSNSRYGPNNATYSIRGFFQELRTTASVATYFADVVAPRQPGAFSGSGDGAGIFQYFDLQNVQVLKGPQGTLSGRNTTGGAVLLVPQKPTSKFGGYIEGSLGNYNARRIQGVINIPLSDSIRFRAGVDYNKRDGYLRNTSGIGPSAFGNVDYLSARASLVIDVTPNIENYTVGAFARSNTVGTLSRIDTCLPTSPNASFTCPIATRLGAANVYTVENSRADPEQDSRYWSVINNTTWNVSDTLTIKNIVSYAQTRDLTKIDPYGSNFKLGATYSGIPVPAAFQGAQIPYAELRAIPGGYTGNQSTFTEEFRLQGRSFDDKLDWQAGGYYENSSPIGYTGTAGQSNFLTCTGPSTNYQCTDILGRLFRQEGNVGNIQYLQQKTKYENIGLYAQGTFKFNDWLSTTAGFRYTWDTTESEMMKYTIRFPNSNDPRLFCLTPGLGAGNPSYNTALGAAAPLAPSLPLSAIGTACHDPVSQKSQAPTWTIGLEAKPVTDLLLYAKYSRGYRQGSTSPFAPGTASSQGVSRYGPENVDVYEIGAKGSWHGAMPGFFNISLFYNDFRQQQVLAGLLIPGQVTDVAILNAGKSRIYGLELETGIQPVKGIHLDANYAYLNSKLESLNFNTSLLPCAYSPLKPDFSNAATACDFIGNVQVGSALPLTPTHKYTISGRVDLPFPDPIGKMDAGLTWSWTSSQVFSYANYPASVFPSYGLLSGNFNWRKMFGSPVDLQVYATNLLGKKYVVKVDENLSRGFIGRLYGEPTIYGARLRFNF